MSNPARRLVALTLVVAILFTLVSCAEKTANVADASKKPGDSSALQDAETASDYIAKLSGQNFGGETFTILCTHTEERPNMPFEEEVGDIFYDSAYRRDRIVEDLFNINIEYISDTDRGAVRTKVMNTVNAQEDAYDLLLTTTADGFNTLAPGGYLYDLRSVDSLLLDEDWWCQSMNEEMVVNGKQYVATGPACLAYLYSTFFVIFNINLASDRGISDESLYNAVIDGKWTIDMLASLIKGVYADLNNNGRADTEDFYGLDLDDSQGNALYAGAGLKTTQRNPDGIPELVIDSERSITVLDKFNSLFTTQDVIQTESLGNDPSGLSYKISLFKNRRSLFSLNRAAFVMSYLRDMEDDYGILPVPKYEESQKSYYTLFDPWMPSGIGLLKTVSDAEKVGIVTDAMAYLGYTTVQPNVLSLTLKEKIARDENSKKMLDIVYDNITVDLNTIFNFGETSIYLRQYAVGSTSNFISTYKKVAKAAQKALEKLMEQYDVIT